MGLDCETAIDYCKQVQCENGGVCHSISETASSKCICPAGFEGVRCNQTVEKNRQNNECLPDTCKNGGSCIEDVNGYSCVCSPGFKGPNCRLNDDGIDENPCSPNPCHSDSICQINATAESGYICKDLACSSSSCPFPKICGKTSEDEVLKCQCPDYQIPRFTDEDCTQCSTQFNGTGCNECAEGYRGTGKGFSNKTVKYDERPKTKRDAQEKSSPFLRKKRLLFCRVSLFILGRLSYVTALEGCDLSASHLARNPRA